MSSCFVRLREEEGDEEQLTTGRWGADSESGESVDSGVLGEPDGALRLPDRRIPLGESGGRIVGTWAIEICMNGRRDEGER